MPLPAQREIVLASLSAAGQNITFTPVQIQKLLFIIDREIGLFIGGPKFNFEPYNYGPFDKEIYTVLEILSVEGLVQTNNSTRYTSYGLTAPGYLQGQGLLSKYPEAIKNFIEATANWIKLLSFEELVAAVYKKYPDMKENSIFKS